MIKYETMIKNKTLDEFMLKPVGGGSEDCVEGFEGLASSITPQSIEKSRTASIASSGGQSLIISRDFSGAFSMILEEAEKLGRAFTYDDIVPFLKEKHDWLPKESVLERYVRKLCEFNLLIRVGKGVYILNERGGR